jgi:hypothetical protein
MFLEPALYYHLYSIGQICSLYLPRTDRTLVQAQFELTSLILNLQLIILIEDSLASCVLLRVFLLKGAHSLRLQSFDDARNAVSSPIFAHLGNVDHSGHAEPFRQLAHPR